MIIIGCDPGLHGAIAILETETGEMQVHDIPVLQTSVKATGNRKTKSGMRTKTEIDVGELTALLCPYALKGTAFIEDVHSMPKQGVASVFSFGFSAGVLRGVIGALGIPYTLVTPQAWKKAMLAGIGSKEKDGSILRAKQLFPKHSSILLKTKDGRAEAMLIAQYGRQTLKGGPSCEKPRRRLLVAD